MDDARRAVRPLERVIVFIGGLLLVGVVLQILSSLFDHEPFFGIGESALCLDVKPWSSEVFPRTGHVPVTGLGDGVSASVRSVSLCWSDPTTAQQTYWTINQSASVVFLWGLLFLIWRMLRRARQHGVFVTEFARRLTHLGLYVIAGAALVSVARMWAQLELQRSLIAGESHQVMWPIGFVYVSLFVGLGLITLGRIVAVTVPMREELDATV
jgi:hypothetical protein